MFTTSWADGGSIVIYSGVCARRLLEHVRYHGSRPQPDTADYHTFTRRARHPSKRKAGTMPSGFTNSYIVRWASIETTRPEGSTSTWRSEIFSFSMLQSVS